MKIIFFFNIALYFRMFILTFVIIINSRILLIYLMPVTCILKIFYNFQRPLTQFWKTFFSQIIIFLFHQAVLFGVFILIFINNSHSHVLLIIFVSVRRILPTQNHFKRSLTKLLKSFFYRLLFFYSVMPSISVSFFVFS